MSARIRTRSLALLAPLALTVACADGPSPDATTLLSPPSADASAAGAHAADPSLPMSGRCEARVVGTPVVVPPTLYQLSEGTCHLTHLGRATLRTEATVHMPTSTQTAEITYTAPNGDQLFARNVGVASPDGTFAGTTTIVGGTGRFAGATGELASSGRFGDPVEIEHDGWIRFAASAKRGR